MNTGEILWQRDGYGSAFGGAYCGGSFYMNDERLIRFDAVTGKQTGLQGPPGSGFAFTSDLATDDSAVYLTGEDGAYRMTCR